MHVCERVVITANITENQHHTSDSLCIGEHLAKKETFCHRSWQTNSGLKHHLIWGIFWGYWIYLLCEQKEKSRGMTM